jgi:hypothetical protein
MGRGDGEDGEGGMNGSTSSGPMHGGPAVLRGVV